MEKNVDNKLETGIIQGCIGITRSWSEIACIGLVSGISKDTSK